MALRGSASMTSTRFGILNFASTLSSAERTCASSTVVPARPVSYPIHGLPALAPRFFGETFSFSFAGAGSVFSPGGPTIGF